MIGLSESLLRRNMNDTVTISYSDAVDNGWVTSSSLWDDKLCYFKLTNDSNKIEFVIPKDKVNSLFGLSINATNILKDGYNHLDIKSEVFNHHRGVVSIESDPKSPLKLTTENILFPFIGFRNGSKGRNILSGSKDQILLTQYNVIPTGRDTFSFNKSGTFYGNNNPESLTTALVVYKNSIDDDYIEKVVTEFYNHYENVIDFKKDKFIIILKEDDIFTRVYQWGRGWRTVNRMEDLKKYTFSFHDIL